jgi:co-chaperonin GroES (HSP10)
VLFGKISHFSHKVNAGKFYYKQVNLLYLKKKCMRILTNNVLVKPVDPSKIITLSGMEFYLDTRFEEQKNAPQAGIVIAVPERLTFSNDMEKPSLSVKTEMELQVGDTVIFNYNAVPHAKSTGMFIGDSVLIAYDMIYCAVRDGQTICLSGSVIVEPESEVVKSNLYIPSVAQNKKHKTLGRVIHAAKKPVDAIRHLPELNTLCPPMKMTKGGEFYQLDRYAKPGDRVMFHFSNAIPLQHFQELHGTISRSLLYRMRHNDIELVLDDDLVVA